MQFVICDDNVENMVELERMLLQYIARHPSLCAEVEKYTDSSALFQKIQHGTPADVYLLDILMSGMTGIDLGQEIRKKSRKSVIIFITVSDDFALDAYNLLAIRYLVKPIGEAAFCEALDYALLHTGNRKEPVYLVKTKNGLEAIPHCQIEYIENAARRMEIHLTNQDVVTSLYIRKSFEEEIKELLHTEKFLCIHKSFLINLSHVRKLSQNHVVMAGGDTLPISRKSFPQVKKNYLLFISEQYK